MSAAPLFFSQTTIHNVSVHNMYDQQITNEHWCSYRLTSYPIHELAVIRDTPRRRTVDLCTSHHSVHPSLLIGAVFARGTGCVSWSLDFQVGIRATFGLVPVTGLCTNTALLLILQIRPFGEL